MKDNKLFPVCAVITVVCLVFMILFITSMVSKSNLNAQLQLMEAENSQQAESIQALEDGQAQRDAQIETLQSQNSELQQQVQALESTVDTMTAESSQKDIQITGLETEADSGSRIRSFCSEKLTEAMAPVCEQYENVYMGAEGTLIIEVSSYFDSGSFDMKEYSYNELILTAECLNQLLSDPDTLAKIDKILVGGYTDSTGTEHANYILTSRRAIAVLERIQSADKNLLAPYSDLFAAAGFGSADPIGDNETVEGRTANRRIEISIVPRLG